MQKRKRAWYSICHVTVADLKPVIKCRSARVWLGMYTHLRRGMVDDRLYSKINYLSPL